MTADQETSYLRRQLEKEIQARKELQQVLEHYCNPKASDSGIMAQAAIEKLLDDGFQLIQPQTEVFINGRKEN